MGSRKKRFERIVATYSADLFRYAAAYSPVMAAGGREFDQALQAGFGMRQGLFGLWQAMGWRAVTDWLQSADAVDDPRAPALPDWVRRVNGVYGDKGGCRPSQKNQPAGARLAVYRRQLRPPPLPLHAIPKGTEWYSDQTVCLWHPGEDVAVLTLKQPLTVPLPAQLDSLKEGLDIAKGRCRALVVEHHGPPAPRQTPAPAVTAPADPATWLSQVYYLIAAVEEFPVPVAAALQGWVGGFTGDLLLACRRRAVGLETYLSLGVPALRLPPLGGGCARLARRAAAGGCAELIQPLVARYAEFIGRGRATNSAVEAQQLGLLDPADPVIANPRELLFVARAQAVALAHTGQRYNRHRPFPVLGGGRLGALSGALADAGLNAAERRLAVASARIICGGEATGERWTTAAELLGVERDYVLTQALASQSLAGA